MPSDSSLGGSNFSKTFVIHFFFLKRTFRTGRGLYNLEVLNFAGLLNSPALNIWGFCHDLEARVCEVWPVCIVDNIHIVLNLWIIALLLLSPPHSVKLNSSWLSTVGSKMSWLGFTLDVHSLCPFRLDRYQLGISLMRICRTIPRGIICPKIVLISCLGLQVCVDFFVIKELMINHYRVFVSGFRHGGNSIAYWFILKESRLYFLSLLCCSEVLHLNCTFACDILCYYCLLGLDLFCVLGFTEIYHTRLWYALVVLAIIFELSAWQWVVHMSKLRSREDSILATVRVQLSFGIKFI